MPSEEIRTVVVWNGWMRIAHWAIAVGTVFLAVSGHAMNRDAVDPAFWRDWHVIAGQLVALALLLRTVLLAVPGTGNLRELLPTAAQRSAIVAMLRFYVTAGNSSLPNWYAHNPIWKPVYLAVLVALALSAVSGLGYHASWYLLGLSMSALHAALALPLALFMAAHLPAVFLHDLKGRNALVSAMISGERIFRIDRAAGGREPRVKVSLDSIIQPGDRRDR